MREIPEILTLDSIISEELAKDGLFVSHIEHCLDKESQHYKDLKHLNDKGILDFGAMLDEHDLQGLLVEIKPQVDSFLGIEKMDPPKIRHCRYSDIAGTPNSDLMDIYAAACSSLSLWGLFNADFFGAAVMAGLAVANLMYATYIKASQMNEVGGFYRPFTKEVIVPYNRHAVLVGTVSHEYAHHIQDELGLFDPHTILMHEGIGRGVERYMSRIYSEKKDNPAYSYCISERNVGELRSVYKFICAKIKREPKRSLLEVKTPIDPIEREYYDSFGLPSGHALGNVYMYLMELALGENACRMALSELHGLKQKYSK